MTKRFWGAFVAGALAVLVLAVWVGPGPAGAQGVTTALMPASLTVAPGSEFDLELQVTQAGSNFNGFKGVVAYDPAALSLVPLSPVSLQQGSLMTDACGNTFHRFQEGTGVDTLTDVLMCNGVSLTGPGQIYRLHFRASNTPQTTSVWIVPGTLKFYDAGLYVTPVYSANARIGIGMPPAAVGDAGGPGGPSLAVAPNPSRGRVVFTLGPGHAGAESLTVRDVQGRVVRKFVPSGRQIAWDGMHEIGRPVPNGTYFATLDAGGRSTTIRFSLVR